MNFLITGGAGSVGRDLTASLLKKGHRVRVLDKHAETLGPLHDNKLDLIPGRLEDLQLVRGALQGGIPSSTWHGLFPTTRSNSWRATSKGISYCSMHP